MLFHLLLVAPSLLAAAASAAPPPLVRTPFGAVHADCVRGVPSGTLVEGLPAARGGGARVRFPDGGEEVVAPCAAEPRAVRPPRRLGGGGRRGVAAAPPPVWDGWPAHSWLGTAWAPFTRPPLPANTTIFSINATWVVPPPPADASGNASDPWAHAAPTLSWWVGVQGPAVVQPVLEWNGLAPGAYDAVSWNCCPAGMAWYSMPLPALPGERVEGAIVRVSGAEVGAAGSLYTYETTTAVVSAARGRHETRLFSAMSDGEPGWTPDWAEAVAEAYYVTSCDRLPCGAAAGAFADVRVAVAPAGEPFNATRAAPVSDVPWSTAYEVAGEDAPGPPVCAGAVAWAAGAANVTSDCAAAH